MAAAACLGFNGRYTAIIGSGAAEAREMSNKIE